MPTYPAIYRAKAASITGQTLQAFVPQVFGDTPISIVNFTGTPPTTLGMGWVFFQGGDPEFPVWQSEVVAAEEPGPGPGPSPGGSFTYTRPVAATIWVIVHNLGFFPNVTVVDTAGDEVVGEVTYDSVNQVTLTFSAAFAGTAYLS